MLNRKLTRSVISSVFIFILIISLASCSRSADIEPNLAEPETPATSDYPLEDTPDDSTDTQLDTSEHRSLSGTLTISQCWDFQNLDIAIRRFTEIHPDVQIVLNKFNNDWERYIAQIGAQLMAGVADDIIDASMLSHVDLSERGFLVDFLPLMQNDPGFMEDDFFMNAFRAFKYRGGLYTFPTSFRYNFVGVNNTLSEELIENFKQFETISHRQMLDLYFEFADSNTYFLSPDMDAIVFVLDNSRTFVDYENRTARFNTDDFIRMLTYFQVATNPQRVADGRLSWRTNWDPTGAATPEFFHRYVFMIASHGNYRAFFPISDRDLFTYYIPFVTDDGYIPIVSTRQFFINSASENIELAWEFLKFLATDEVLVDLIIGRDIPIKREHYRNHTPAYITKWVNQLRENHFIIEGETQDIVKDIISNMEKWNEMPMQSQRMTNVTDMILETLISFHNGFLTAQQAAEELQNRVSLYLMERG